MTAHGTSDLEGRRAVVTGASRGIGLAIAHQLAARGAEVLMLARSADRLAQVRDAVAGAQPVHVHAADLTRSSEVTGAFRAARERMGGIDILVNNAGDTLREPVASTSDDQWRHLIDVNLTSTFLCVREAAPHLLDSERGRVINVSSAFALVGVTGYAAYAAAKAGVIGFTRALAVEWARHGVRVNAVAPGHVATDLTREWLSEPASREQALKRIPVRRIAQPSEIAGLVGYLAGDAGDFITGQVLVADGGYTAI